MNEIEAFGHELSAQALPEPSRNRYELLRAGIQNIWEYDDQRFVFNRGRLLLRGRNEAGKSKALEVLLPFLLDADLSPQRLDPFGSTSRQMRWNLLGDRAPDKEIGLGYVWIELGRNTEEGSETITLGAGMKARRSDTKVDSWLFITGRRVDRDLHLVDSGRRPLERRKLEEALGDSGTVFRSKTEYRKEVDRRLFGLGAEQYDALIDTLIQLRKPQLSKQLDPAQLSRILTAALPQLERDVIGRLAEGFARLDRHRSERDAWKRSLDAVESFRRSYRSYAERHVAARSQAMTRADSEHQKARASQRSAEQDLEAARGVATDLEREIHGLEREDGRLRAHQDALRSSDAFKAVAELHRRRSEAKERAQEAKRALRDVEREEATCSRALSTMHRAANELTEQEQRLVERLASAERAALECAMAEGHAALVSLIELEDVAAASGALSSLLEERRSAIAKVEAAQRGVEEATRAVERARHRLESAEDTVRAAEDRLMAAMREKTRAEEKLASDVETWLGGISAIALSESEAGALLGAELDEMRPLAEEAVARRRNQLIERMGELLAEEKKTHERFEKVSAEREDLFGRGHNPPEAPRWRSAREERPGAPLYLLCEPGDALHPDDWARIEAALEASGLLDAWVMADGKVLDAGTFDLLLDPKASGREHQGLSSCNEDASPPAKRTLADVVVPVAAGGVSEEMAVSILGAIHLVEDTDTPSGAVPWVATDGRFGLGPLSGSWRKEAVEHLGAKAREDARQRRLEQLEALLSELTAERERLERELLSCRALRDEMEAELGRFPSIEPLFKARAKAEAAGGELEHLRREASAASDSLRAERGRLEQQLARRDAVASETKLTGWVGELPKLRELMGEYRTAAGDVIHAADSRCRLVLALQEKEALLREAEVGLDRAKDRARASESAAEEAEETARTLEAAMGATRDQILEEVHDTETRISRLGSELRESREKKSRSERKLGKLESSLDSFVELVRRTGEEREEAARSFRRLASAGLLHELDLQEEDPRSPASWTLTDTLLAARRVISMVKVSDWSQQALDRAENRVVTQHTELGRLLASGVRLAPAKDDGILVYQASMQGRQESLRELARILLEEVASRDHLLDAEERELFESFLSGETHEHLRARLREARALVDKINEELRERPMPGGMLIRLDWRPHQDAPPGTSQAIDLLLRSAAMLSGSDRDSLAAFLRRRLEEARSREAEEPGTGLSERMLEVLDYRSWFSFTVEYKEASGAWRPLTKKVHGAGSGGQKSVMLHLPLFAAAAAFFASAREGAPRMVLLDEAFAGIDKKMRGRLMGLLVAFDLDFVMTSYEEWGFYAELDGLSTYNLVRDPALPGVLCERFVWNGREEREVAA